MANSKEVDWAKLAQVLTVVVLTPVAVLSLLFGSPLPLKIRRDSHLSTTTSTIPVPTSTVTTAATPTTLSVVQFTGKCDPFRVYAQNRWLPYGTRKLRAPDPLATQIGGFDPNQIIALDGWVHAAIAFPNNTPPFNSDIWYHLADNSGWVAFGAVRAVPTDQDPTLRADGGAPAPTPSSCEGGVH